MRVAAAVAAVAGLLVGATSARPASLAIESFYDELHGWRAHRNLVQETNDGGRTWRTLAGDDTVDLVLRTGLHAGLYTAPHETFWTNGTGFFTTAAIRVPAAGAGRFLFRWRGDALSRVTPWPFPHPCVNFTEGEECVYDGPDGKRRIARFTLGLVFRLPTGIGDAATIPAGVVAVSVESRHPVRRDAPFVALARWTGPRGTKRVLVRPLPTNGRALTPCASTLGVDWPRLVVSACEVDGADQTVQPVGLWRTLNGGRDWQLYASVR